MTRTTSRWLIALAAAGIAVLIAQDRPVAGQEGFKFKSGVELINVTATVTDRTGGSLRVCGRKISRLRRRQPVEVTHFSAERTPVSLGIVLDTSGSMAGEKMESARDAPSRDSSRRSAIRRTSSSSIASATDPDLVSDWTNNRGAVSRALARMSAVGRHGDVRRGRRSSPDGAGRTESQEGDRADLRRQRHQQPVERERRASRWFARREVLVYAVGIDGQGEADVRRQAGATRHAARHQRPSRFPAGGGRRGGGGFPFPVPGQVPRGRRHDPCAATTA